MSTGELLREFLDDTPIILTKLEEWAKTCADKTAFYYGEHDRRISYAEIHRLSNTFGRNLATMGVAKGDRVSLFLKNPLATTLAMFGIWKVGAVFSPINFNYKGRLLSYQINDTDPALLITEQGLLPMLNSVAADLPALPMILYRPKQSDHDYTAESAGLRQDSKFRPVDFDDALKGDHSGLDTEINYWDTANIVYTSGTTGPAKGVVQSHRWMGHYTFNGRQLAHPDLVYYNDLPLYHIGGSIYNVAGAIWAGSKVAVWDKFSPTDFWQRIESSGSTNAVLLDVMIPWLMNAPKSPQDLENTLSRVHMQPLPQYHHEVAKRFGIDFITAGYGQTETGNSHVALIDEWGDEAGTPPELYKGYSKEELRNIVRRCGWPIVAGDSEIKKGFMGTSVIMEASVINEQDEEVAPRQYGQLALRCPLPFMILDEYFNKPEATVDAFRNFWFHTGDACYKDEDGIYYFVDRMGAFIRARGENISSFQIEDFVNSHPQVEICTAFPIPADEGDEDDIVVYVVPKPDEYLSADDLEEWCRGEMPKFMWPKHFRFVDDLPRTPTNKVEKYKLKEKILRELGKE